MPRHLAALALTAALAASGPAHAQRRGRVHQLYEDAAAAYEEADFERSERLLQRAYELRPEPIFLYNIARARESRGAREGALEAYRRFLAEAPAEDALRPRVERVVEVLDAQLRDEAREPASRADVAARSAALRAPAQEGADAPRDAPGRAVNPVPWVIVGVAALAAGGAGVLGWLATEREAEAEAAPDHRTGVGLAQESYDLATASNVLWIAAGGLAAVGLLWGSLDLTLGGEPSEALTLRGGPGGVAVEGTWW